MSEDLFAQMEAVTSARIERAPTDDQSSRLTTLGVELARTQDWINRATELLKERQARVQQILTKDLVDLMDEMGQDKIGLPDSNVDLVLSTKYKAVLPKPGDKDTPEEHDAKLVLRRKGLDFLVADGADGMINTVVVLTFPKGEAQRARQIAAEMEDRARELAEQENPTTFDVEVDESVHWGTLTSYVREQIEDKGRSDLPMDALGAQQFRIVELKKRKAKK